MSANFDFNFEPIEGALDDPVDNSTLARVWITAGERILTRCANRRTGTRDYIKLPLYGLALGLAENWWTLLYEPWRPEEASNKRIARHRLDSFTKGYAFPALALWSAGEEALTVATSKVSLKAAKGTMRWEKSAAEAEIAALFGDIPRAKLRDVSRVQFIDESNERMTVSRAELEGKLYALIDEVVEWSGEAGDANDGLLEARWALLQETLNDPAMTNYCVAAGRLGFDPYDEETPDISIFAAHLPEDSFDDLCEAATFEEISEASAWVVQEQERLGHAATLQLNDFGRRPFLDPEAPAWKSGYRAALQLRSNLSLDEDPVRAVRQIFGDRALLIDGSAPPAVEGLVVREPSTMRSIVVASDSAQARFRRFRSVYLGWGADPGSYPLLTTASTHRQQASRAFAAEMLCPSEYLRHVTPKHGLTTDRIAEIALKLDCSTSVVEHQARNHRIPLRGVY